MGTTAHPTTHWRRAVPAAAALLALAGCGGGTRQAAPATPVVTGGESTGFDDVIGAVQRAKVALCTPPEGGAYVPLGPPPAPAAATAPYFRYLEGRIYQFAPCEVAPAKRNELRIFRYPDGAVRDAAIRAMATRTDRPTAAFAVGDAFEAQIWSPDPSLEGPVGQAAAAVHSALGHLDGAHHLDLEP